MTFEVVRISGQSYNSLPNHSDTNFFIDRKKDSNMLLIILAGYKPYLFEDVFARVKAFAPE